MFHVKHWAVTYGSYMKHWHRPVFHVKPQEFLQIHRKSRDFTLDKYMSFRRMPLRPDVLSAALRLWFLPDVALPLRQSVAGIGAL
jgi:hypothetical protein